jgi:phosphatidylinositol alpha-1,6-mannosyltransferase
MGYVAGRIIKAKVAIYVYGGDLLVVPQSFLLGSIVRFLLRRADLVLCNSRETKSDAESLGLPPERGEVLYHGTDRSRFRPGLDGSQIRKSFAITEDETMVFTVGRLVPYKGLDYLLAAAQHTLREESSLRFVIGGAGPLKERLQTQIEDLGLSDKVALAGLIPESQLALYYAASDIYVSSSVVDPAGNREGLGLTIIEAMAAGKPVIVTDAGAPKEYIKDGENGLIVEQKNHRTLANAIIRLTSDSELRERLVNNGLATVSKTFECASLIADLEKYLMRTKPADAERSA